MIKTQRFVLASSLLMLVAGCTENESVSSPVVVKPDPGGYAPTINTVTLGEDFVDKAGRRWACKGLATSNQGSIEEKPMHDDAPLGVDGGAPSGSGSLVEPRSREEIARAVRPVQVLGGYVYELSEPDYITADMIMAFKRSGQEPRTAGSPSAQGELKPTVLVYDSDGNGNIDERVPVNTPASGTHSTAQAHLTQGCSMTMIGPHTAVTAAHCIFRDNGWRLGTWHGINCTRSIPAQNSNPVTFTNVECGEAAWGANNSGPLASSYTLPLSWSYTYSVIVPSQWLAGCGAAANTDNCETTTNHPNWDYDYGFIDFPGTPGNSTGWLGTVNPVMIYFVAGVGFVGTAYHLAYPMDKLYRSQWMATGGLQYTTGARNVRIVHYLDVVNGQSGGCVDFFSGSIYECSGIQSGQYTNANVGPFGLWNETRMWDSELYSFAHTNYSWP